MLSCVSRAEETGKISFPFPFLPPSLFLSFYRIKSDDNHGGDLIAVMASDFSAAQFCFLERLLVVHGDIGVIRGSHRCKSHFTWIQHLFIWGSIAMWYLFLFVYDKLSPPMSGNAYRLLVEALAPAPIFGQTPSWERPKGKRKDHDRVHNKDRCKDQVEAIQKL
ncbi:hypothetical protein V6N12_029655 [Hibiscus sabdariffa]|uniref:P-type ATPase C-terminal domain-containing protein n=1 Tax=Hibiscus sabdariffa TaxID=183260 RepID=A0ABR2CWR9_9ROSI